MKRNNFKISLLFITAIILTFGLSISFQSLLAAWTAPLANPPTCLTGDPGCDGPINIGSFQQTKGGPLRVNADNLAATGFVAYGNVGIGTTAPGYKLDVQGGNTNITNYLLVNGKYAIDGTDSYLRLNQQGSFPSGIYTPGVFRVSGIVYTDSSFRYIGSGNTIMDSNQFYCNNGSNCHFNYSGSGGTHVGNGAGTWLYGPAYANGGAICASNNNCGYVTSAGAVPQGAIIMWSGSLAAIPSGWALCDGTNGTPDLRDKFIYGVSAGENPGATGGYSSHSHTVDIYANSYTGQLLSQAATPVQWIKGGDDVHTWRYYTSGTENYSFAGKRETTAGANNLPPYYKLAFIMKL